jgi:uncharacterized protein
MMDMNVVERFVQQETSGETSGHDWFHVQRVCNNAKMILAHEPSADSNIVLASALLHDIPDRKLTSNIPAAFQKIAETLAQAGFSSEQSIQIEQIIKGVSFQGAGMETPMESLEGRIVQDADRLDALGAVGIARCFAYGGKKGRMIYDPAISPVLHDSAEGYFQSQGTSLNHFQEKLFLLRDRMQTAAGKKAAAHRHRFLEEYFARFISEWNCQDLTG